MKPGSKFIFMTLLAVGLVGCSGSRPPGKNQAADGNAMVPYAYRGLYNELYTKLDSLRSEVGSQSKGNKSGVSFGVELLTANSNRGEILLQESVLAACRLSLERLKDLGVQSIALSIQYPILTSSFPRAAEYRGFYRQVAEEIRNRGFVLIVEIGTIFREPEFSKLKISYNGLTLKRFGDGLREMTEAIITDMRPDYLTLLTEPDTQARNTGLDFSMPNFAAAIRKAVSGLNPSGVRLGAGAGTWDDPAYFQSLARIAELDYLDLHIYPIQRDFVVDRVWRVADMARRHNKSVSIGESWLYKVSERELGKISPVKALARDVYSFWQPLDIMFLETIIDLSQRIQADFCSFFWMNYLYGYLEYNSKTKSLTPQQLINSVNAVAGRQILENRLDDTGIRFKELIRNE
jgi:hypothetical protein